MMSGDKPVKGWKPLFGETPSEQTPPSQGILSSPSGQQSKSITSVQLTPRLYVEPPKQPFEIEAPPPKPSAPTSSVWVIAISIVVAIASFFGMIAYAVISYQSSQQVGGNNPMSQLWWLLLSGVGILSSLAGVAQQVRDSQKHKRELIEREQKYRSYLTERKTTANQLHAEQRSALLRSHPDFATCLRRVQDRDRSLWERTSVRDFGRDYLDVRIGVGRLPASFPVKTPSTQGYQVDADPLLKEALQIAKNTETVEHVPIVLPITKVGMTGIAGIKQQVQHFTRAVLTQIVTHHPPSEVKIVLTFSQTDQSDWSWARWLPHVWSDDRQQRFVASTPDDIRRLLGNLTEQLQQRELALQDNNQALSPIPFFVIVFADTTIFRGPDAASFARLLKLLEKGRKLGAYALFLHERVDEIAKECGAIIDLYSGLLRIVGPPPEEISFAGDAVSVEQADRFARLLAPLRIKGGTSALEIPTSLSLFEMLSVQRAEDIPIVQNWQDSQPDRTLATPIGKAAGDEMVFLDLHARSHGPHGLVAGTTGAGKSELLQTIVISLAIHYHPHELAFVLVDYKGGGMAAPFRDLPHLVGMITNLDAHLVPRAINALSVENVRRQQIFSQVGVSDIKDYQQLYRQRKVTEPLPHLVVIVDEFAELSQNQSDLMQNLISTARVGRSLGVHLILATQKPAGVVNEQIWSNSNFRLCLRVAQPEDSQEMLKRPDAAQIPNSLPGRCYFQVGQNEIFKLFQSAYSGAPVRLATLEPQILASRVYLDGKRESIESQTVRSRQTSDEQKQLSVVVNHIKQIAKQERIAKLDPLWLPPLPKEVSLGELRRSRAIGWDGHTWRAGLTWMEPIIGLVDIPSQRQQSPLSVKLMGHLAICGAPASGKTMLLQTVALSVAYDHTPEQVNMYMLDFGGRRLRLFEQLPHVGSVILPDDKERIAKLFDRLHQELNQRKEDMSLEGENNFAYYHQRKGGRPPAIIVYIDNFAAFAREYPEQADQLAILASEGGNYGIYLVLTAGSWNQFPLRLANNLSEAIALKLNDPGEYPEIVGQTHGLLPDRDVPGRGLIRMKPPLEFQAAHPGDQPNDQSLRDSILRLSQSWHGPKAHPIQILPSEIGLCSILTPSEAWDASADYVIPIGLDGDTIQQFDIDLRKMYGLVITGSASSGKTTLMQTILLAAAEKLSPDKVHFYLSGLTDTQLQPFKSLPHTKTYLEDAEQFQACLNQLISELRKRENEYRQAITNGLLDRQKFVTERYPLLLLAIDDYADVRSSFSADDSWKELLKLGKSFGLLVVISASTSYFQTAYSDALFQELKQQPVILLGGTDIDSINLFNIKLKPEEKNQIFDPGRGYYRYRANQHLFQAASCHSGTLQMIEWIELIRHKH